MKFVIILALTFPAILLALCATVVTVQLIDAGLPDALDGLGRVCLGLFYGTLFSTWTVFSRLPRMGSVTKI
jgi:hypothetical protein